MIYYLILDKQNNVIRDTTDKNEAEQIVKGSPALRIDEFGDSDIYDSDSVTFEELFS